LIRVKAARVPARKDPTIEDGAMNVNELPRYDDSVNTTGCCPKFNPEGWDGQELHFRDLPVVKATTHSVMHVPVDMGRVFSRVQGHIEAAGAGQGESVLVLSRDDSPWKSTHFFAVDKEIPGEEMAALSGDYVTKVFEGPYSAAKGWSSDMQQVVRDRKREPGEIYFFYTTCPKCAKAYGSNYVVGVAEMR
jgi:hypothetical protein